jgi:hypothetical protein
VFRPIVTLILLLVSLIMIIIMTRISPFQTTTTPRQSAFHLIVSRIPNPTAKEITLKLINLNITITMKLIPITKIGDSHMVVYRHIVFQLRILIRPCGLSKIKIKIRPLPFVFHTIVISIMSISIERLR